MRRTALYTTGLTLAAGAGLALAAGPASASPGAGSPRHWGDNYPSYQSRSPIRQLGGFQPGRGGFQPFRGGSANQFNFQISINNQIILNNIGNTQIGQGNFNGGGSAGATNFTSLFGGIFRR